MNIGFIGLGNMGLPMAVNLSKQNHKVVGFDIVKKTDKILEIASSLSNTVENKNVVITMLPDGVSLLKVYKDIVNFLSPDTVLVDCSTVDVGSAKEAALLAKKRGFSALDAPVSGGIGGAQNGTLTFMVGGNEGAFEIAKPLFEIMGQKAVLCGDSGAGQSVKICNNMILGISMIGVCEAFSMAEKLGLDNSKMFDVVSNSSGSCWSINTYCPVPNVGPKTPADNNYTPGFSTDLMLKDLGLANAASSQTKSFTPLGEKALNLYQKFYEEGGKGKDFSAIIEYIKASGSLL